MKIKRLELVGFKSFVLPTVIDFDASIVGIVGPNGCGKSNVIDAIRWVMGETSPKNLRGRSMEDVIFNGSEKRAANGLAEVTLTFSTEDGIAPAQYATFAEVSITRRLYRSGESEYLINKIPSRLRDVVDLFLGTGAGARAYSIMEQGRVDFVINAKPEERRLLLEEAAGVSKFKARKEGALRKMEGTEQNLIRLRDIVNEVRRQMASLERQVKKAEKYKLIKNELRELDLKLAALNFQENTSTIQELKAKLETDQTNEASFAAELSTFENQIQEKRLTLVEKERELSAIQEKIFDVGGRLKLLETQQIYEQKEIQELTQKREKARTDLTEMAERLQSFDAEKINIQEELEKIVADASVHASDVQAVEEELRTRETQRQNCLNESNELRNNLLSLESQLNRLEGEKKLFDDRRISLQEQLSLIEVDRHESQTRFQDQSLLLEEKTKLLTDAEALKKELFEKIQNTEQTLRDDQERRNLLFQELNLRREELLFKKSRLTSLLDLEKSFEGYDDGIKSLLQWKNQAENSGLQGTLAEVVETSPEFERAVGAALGDRLQSILCDNFDSGFKALNHLKEGKLGRGSLVSQNLARRVSAATSSSLEKLLSKITIRAGYENLIQSLLAETYLVSNLNEAVRLRSEGHQGTFVTYEGDLLDADGFMLGGSGNLQGQSLLEKKREIKELHQITDTMTIEVESSENHLKALEDLLTGHSKERENLLQEIHQSDLQITTLQKETQHLVKEKERLERELAKFGENVSRLSGEAEKTSDFELHYEQKKNELLSHKESVLQELQNKDVEVKSIEQEARLVQERLTTLRIQLASTTDRKTNLTRDLERIERSTIEWKTRQTQTENLIQESLAKEIELHSSLEMESAELTELKETLSSSAQLQEDLRKVCGEKTNEILVIEQSVKELRKNLEVLRQVVTELRIDLSKRETDLSHLEAQILERYAVNLQESATTFLPTEPIEGETPWNRGEAEIQAVELREKLERLGEVNMGALPEYEELKTREAFLAGQIQDLENSLDQLRKAIQRINETTKQRFEETFALVNERFQTLFPRLFQGGRAEIRLTDENDTLNAGVELLAQPRGKKLAHLGLLSGGEKALSAIAFIFAIFLVKPSPFCLLDEVDAPLDEVNTDRFHTLIHEMADRTQFILITHNRRTMEKSDLLYGVTMQEPGVSQIVSVRLSEGLKMAS